MYQRCFDNASETLFVVGKTPRLSRFAFSDDPKWESGHHVHGNDSNLLIVFYVQIMPDDFVMQLHR
ncbi:hypothetical protein G7L65_23185, partial [Shigella sonnei]|nr:hypothetical protein [Shigella sonnei]